MIQILGLRGDTEISIEGSVRFTVAEKIDRERRTVRDCELGGDIAPKEAAGAEPVYEQNGGAAVAIALHVHGARANRDAQQVGVYGSLHGETGYHDLSIGA